MISTILSLTTASTYLNSSFLEQLANTTAAHYSYSSVSTIDIYNGTIFNDTISPLLPSYIRNTSMVFCIVIMCLGVIGNIMVPIVIFKTKDMRNSTNIFLVNLSVADLMVLLVCTPTVLIEVNSKPETWVLGKEMCKAVPFVELTVAHASVLTILAISFERYYAICKPLEAGYICTKARASLICLLAWFIAAICTSPVLAITEYREEDYFDGSIVFVCFTLVETLLPCLFFIGSIVIFFIFPLALLIFIYALIAKTLITHPTALAPLKSATIPPQSVIKYRKQVIVMLATVVLAFFICLLPFRALTLWIIVAPAGSNFEIGFESYYNLLYFSRIMFHINSAINPILYNIMSSKFRSGFMKLCGVRNVCKSLKRRPEIIRKSTTSSSTHTSSQNTSDSFLGSSGKKKQSKFSSNLDDVKEVTSTGDSVQSCHSKEVYVRAPLDFSNGISGQRFANGEIFL